MIELLLLQQDHFLDRLTDRRCEKKIPKIAKRADGRYTTVVVFQHRNENQTLRND